MLNKALFTVVILLTSTFAFAGTSTGIEHAGIMGLQLTLAHFVVKTIRTINKEYKQSQA